MKKYIYIIFGIFLMLTACQELELTPETELSDASLWKNSEDYERGANLLYKLLPEFRTDNDSDIGYSGVNEVSNGTRVTPTISGFYNSSYSNIRRCNFLIDRALANGFENDRYVAEIRFFRAFFYSELVNAYGDVQFYTRTIDPGNNEDLYAARTPRATVVDFILSELNDVASILPLESKIASADKGRIASGTAVALRARVALFEATWAKYHDTGDDISGRLDIAISSAKSVMDSGQYGLFEYATKPDESYRYFFMELGNDSNEQILAFRYDFSQPFFASPLLPATRKLADMYLSSDGLPIDKSSLYQGKDLMDSEFENRDRRMTASIVVPGTFTISRLDQEGSGIDFPNGSEGGQTFTYYRSYKQLSEFYHFITGGNSYFAHNLRYAEVLLIYAEALYEKNGSITDPQLNESINLLRQRAGIAALTNTLVSGNGLDMLNEIRRERTVELAHEGFRRDDLRRWKTAELEMPKAILGAKFGGTEFETKILVDNDGQPILDENGNEQLLYKNPPLQDAEGYVLVETAASRTFRADRDYLEPFPTEEIIKNSNLKQNPNW